MSQFFENKTCGWKNLQALIHKEKIKQQVILKIVSIN